MIYVWGLVASGKSKKLFSHGRHQDWGVFRPSYGDISARLLGINVPLLLLSATCWPQAIKRILESLKITEEAITYQNAELSRPEIRIVWVPMKCSLKSCDNLLRLYGPQSCIPDKNIIPALIYSTTRNLTMQVSKVLHKARRIPNGHRSALSSFAQRFHSNTGETKWKNPKN
jgi:superfamily II DNA helicase RecQ